MVHHLINGIVLGFVAGISPGPILTLVITETIKHNRKEGFKLALSPLFSDAPIVFATIFIIDKLSSYDLILAIISFMGAIFIMYLAWENIKIKSINIDIHNAKTHNFRKGIIANLLSPHPYLFWLLVGAPFTIKAYNENLTSAVLFILGFYIFIIGTKLTVAFITEKSKKFISSSKYLIIIKLLGFILLIFSVILIKDGVKFLGIW